MANAITEEMEIEEDKSLDFLKTLNIKEISKTTHIGEIQIENLFSKNFKDLNETRALGFINIIEIEYSLDLHSLKQEYLEYQENNISIESKLSLGSDSLNKKQRLNKIILLILFVTSLVLFIVFNFVISKDINISEKFTLESIEQDLKSIEEDKKDIENNISIVPEIDKVSLTKEDNISISEETQIKTPKTIKLSSDIPKVKAKVKKLSEIVEKKIVNQVEQQIEKEELKTKIQFVTIAPKTNLWFGVIDLKNNKRKQYISKKDVPLRNSNDLLIITGHGLLRVKTNLQNINLSSKQKVYIYKTESNIKVITKEKAKVLTNGKLW